MDNSSSDDRRDRSSQNRQGQRGGRRRQNNRGENHSSGGGQNRRNRSGGGDSRNQSSGKREYRPSNRGRQQTPKKPSFGQRLLSILSFGILGGSSKPAPSGKSQSENRNDGKNRSRDNKRDDKRPAEKVEVDSARLYVGNLDYKTTDSDLKEYFSKLGTVKSAEIVINRRTQQSKGFAFVEMDSIDEARKAVDSYHNEDFMGRRMLVSGAKSSGASEGDNGGRSSNNDRNRNSNQRSDSNRSDNNRNERNDRNDRGGNRRSEAREEPARKPKKTEAPVELTGARLRLDNLDYEVGEEELEELFKGIGVVVGTEVVANPDTHQSKGYGYVEMSHIDEAQRAVEILNNKDFMGRRLTMSDGSKKEEAKTPAATETPATEDAPAAEEIAEEDKNETTPAVGA